MGDSTRIDVCGRMCPMPLVTLKRTLANVDIGQVVEIVTDDRLFSNDLEAWCRHEGHQMLSLEGDGDRYVAKVKRGK